MSPFVRLAEAQPHVRYIDGGPAYTVQVLMRSHHHGWVLQYLEEGYGIEERSCVPAFDSDLFIQFHQDHPAQP